MSRINEEMQQAVDALAKIMCQSEEFKQYQEAKQQAVNDPDKMAMIKQAQILRERLHAIPEQEIHNEYAERTQTEYEELMEDTVVYKYTKAELAIGGICRDVFAHILDAMEF